MRDVVIYSWYVSMIVELMLLWRLRRERSAFTLWLFVDFILWVVLLVVELIDPRGVFITAWQWLQIPLMVALALAAIEQLICREWRLTCFLAAICSAEVGYLAYPHLMYGAHVGLSGALAAALVSRWVICGGMCKRGAIMCVFLAVDSAGYLAECFGCIRFEGSTLLVVGEGLCLASWLSTCDSQA